MKRVSKSMIQAIKVTQAYMEKIENGKKEIKLTYDRFKALTYVARKAAEEVGLKFSYGILATGNNRKHCRYLYFPGRESQWFKNGDRYDTFWLSNVKIIQIKREKISGRSIYRFRVIDTIKKVRSIDKLVAHFFMVSKELAMNEVTLSQKELYEFLSHYNQWLIKLEIISPDLSNIIEGLHISDFRSSSSNHQFPDEKGPYLSWRSGDSVYCSDTDESKNSLPTFRVQGDEILFAATIFSLLKPLFKICNIKANIDFVLQLQLKMKKSPNEFTKIEKKEYEDALWLLELQTHMWCDYRDWPINRNIFESRFRKKYHSKFSLNFIENQGFPILLFGYIWLNGRGDDESDEDIYNDISELSHVFGKKRLSAEELSHLCSAECLPILIPLAPLKRDYPQDKCLTITLDISNARSSLRHRDPEWDKESATDDPNYIPLIEHLMKLHGRINQYYMNFMERLNGYPVEIARKNLHNCYQRALSVMGTKTRAISPRDEHLAVILCSLYFLQETLPENQMGHIGLFSYIKEFEELLGVCSVSEFAQFIEECLSKGVGGKNIILYQDDVSIYLQYKEYWPAFQKFCERNRIKLTISAASFRRNVLAKEKLITPQYQVSSKDKYPRYDYRKMIDGVEETVLKLSMKILEYF